MCSELFTKLPTHACLCILHTLLSFIYLHRTAQLRSAQDVNKVSLGMLSLSKALEEGAPIGQQLQVMAEVQVTCVQMLNKPHTGVFLGRLVDASACCQQLVLCGFWSP
jgi:hypothetical protein